MTSYEKSEARMKHNALQNDLAIPTNQLPISTELI